MLRPGCVARSRHVLRPGNRRRRHRIGSIEIRCRHVTPGHLRLRAARQKDQSRRQRSREQLHQKAPVGPAAAGPEREHFALSPEGPDSNFIAKSGGPWAGSGRRRRKPAPPVFSLAAKRRSACGRGLSRACVIDKSLAWWKLGQYRCLNCGAIPAQGLQRNRGATSSRAVQARPFLRDVERPSLNLRNCGSRRTSGGPVGAASVHGAPTMR